MPLDETIVAEAKSHRDGLLALQHELERVRADYHHAIRRLHAAGASMREIAESLGVSHQRVHQILEEDAGEAVLARLFRQARKRLGGALRFERFTRSAREVVVLARDEAESLGHGHVGTEHLLLGLLRVEGVGRRALESLGVTGNSVRDRLTKVIGETGEGGPSGRLPFTPRAKKVLELSLREALRLGHNYIGTEHVLLGLVAESEGIAAKLLFDHGADPTAVREAVLRVLAREAPAV